MPRRPRVTSADGRPACECGSANVAQNGKRHNKSGSVARWLCADCGRSFTGRDGHHKRRAEPRIIAIALDLYFRGLSFRKVAAHIRHAHGLALSAMTIYRWVAHYGALAARWMDEQGARTGERWHVDETVINVNGEQRYLWNVMDADTRFLLATHISRARGLHDTKVPFKRATNATPDRPLEILSDGMPAYRRAIELTVGHDIHKRVPSIRAEKSNNRIERLHGTEKERIKVMRAFDNERGAATLAEGQRVHYNLIREHSTLGTTPGEAAGIAALDGFKWLSLLARVAAES